ncbi:MAG: ABATE domain-containing protein [Anaerolineales bacterium]|jgi:predicted RNA-binding Zn ribbon-like protein
MSYKEWINKWDFEAGRLPLDFANSAEWHAAPEPTEKINSYGDLVGWSWAAGLLKDQEADQLLDRASREPEEAARALEDAIEVREAIYQLFSAIAADRPLPSASLAYLNRAIANALGHVRLVTSGDGFEWGWDPEAAYPDRMLWPILRSTAELLVSEELERVGECDDDRGCGYLFLDTTRNHSRRWCSMESCGNRAKARRFYERSKS